MTVHSTNLLGKVWKLGKEHNIARGVGGYDYVQSNEASEYTTNVNGAVQNGFKTIFGVGYLLKDSIEAAAAQNPDTQFGIIDDVIEAKTMLFLQPSKTTKQLT